MKDERFVIKKKKEKSLSKAFSGGKEENETDRSGGKGV